MSRSPHRNIIQGIQGLTGASGVISGNLDVTNISSTFLTTTRTSGIRNSSYPMSFENICSPANFIKTTGLVTDTNKIVYTTSGIYRLYASTVASSNSTIENIFDGNVSTSWTTSVNSYTKLSSTSAYTHSTFSHNVTGLGLVYGEWIKIRFPRRCYVKDVFFTPFSLPTSITEGYLLGSNNEVDWDPVYPLSKTFTNLNDSSLLTVGGFLASIYTGTDKSYQYFTVVATKIQGTSGADANSTEKFAITNLRFTLHESWIYNDNITSVGNFPLGTPVSNAIDVNGNTYVSGQIITEGGINVFNGQLTVTSTSTLTGNVGVGEAPHATYKLDVNGTLNATSVLVGGNPVSGSRWSLTPLTTNIFYNEGNVGIGTTNPQSSYKLQVQGSSWIENQLVFNNGYRGGGGTDYACNKIYLYGGGNTPTTTSVVGEAFGFGVAAGGLLEYFTFNNHIFYTGTTGGTNYGTPRMRIAGNGAVGIHKITVDLMEKPPQVWLV